MVIIKGLAEEQGQLHHLQNCKRFQREERSGCNVTKNFVDLGERKISDISKTFDLKIFILIFLFKKSWTIQPMPSFCVVLLPQ